VYLTGKISIFIPHKNLFYSAISQSHRIRFAAMKSALVAAAMVTIIIMFVAFSGNSNVKYQPSVLRKNGDLGKSKSNSSRLSYNQYKIPSRVLRLLEKNEIVGDHLADIKAGKSTVEEALHGEKQHTDEIGKPPMTTQEIIAFFNNFLNEFHKIQLEFKNAKFHEIWQAYHEYAVKTLYPWDRKYLQRMQVRRDDDSIFLSLASYRDENARQDEFMHFILTKMSHLVRTQLDTLLRNCGFCDACC